MIDMVGFDLLENQQRQAMNQTPRPYYAFRLGRFLAYEVTGLHSRIV